MKIHTVAASLLLLLYAPSYANAETVPAGTILQLRLRQTVSSYGTPRGTEVRAILIAPVVLDGKIVVPLGTEISGLVEDSRRVGMGFVREAAWIHLDLDSLHFPGGRPVPIPGKITRIDNARETIDAKGRIVGIRATASMSSMISGFAITAAALDPMLLAFSLSSSLSTFRIPESEIVLPTGAELHFETTAPLLLDTYFPPAVPDLQNSQSEGVTLDATIRELPFRTVTQGSNIPSDLTNLAFLGTERAVRTAFEAAGWFVTDAKDAHSSYGALRSIVENQGYKEAPMSTLLLNGKAPRITYSKTLNTFFQRHHLRVFAQEATFKGQLLWTASSTHDSGIGFVPQQKTFIHLIDQNIDEERSKVVNDLILTGCVTAVQMVARPWVPLDASNATGDRLITDGQIAVVRLNDCSDPKRSDSTVAPSGDPGTRPAIPKRVTRNTVLTLRNDLLRGNIGYQGYQGVKLGIEAIKGRTIKPGDQARQFNFAGQSWHIVSGGSNEPHVPGAPKDPNPKPSFSALEREPGDYKTFLEFSISAGYSRFANGQFSTQPLIYSLPIGDTAIQFPINGETSLRPGFNLSGSSTFTATRYLSHELGFTWNTTKLNIDIVAPLVPTSSIKGDADIRQFHYALLLHARPNGKRWRPYGAIGGGMQVVRLLESQAQGNRYLRYTFRELNILFSAFRFGHDPPLEGGAIFQPTLHYGGGIKFYATRRLVLRADFRETLSAQPDFWTKSASSLRQADDDGTVVEPLPLVKHGRLRQQRISIGVGIAF